MRNRNLLKKLMSLVLVITMTFAFSICSFAKTHNEGTGYEVEDVEEVTFSKTLKTDINVAAPNETFKIKITTKNSDFGTYDGQEIKKGLISAFGNDSDGDGVLYFDLSISNSNSATTSSDGSYQTYSYSGSASIDASVFSSAGIYEYVVSEVEGSNNGMSYDDVIYYLYVIVLYCGEDSTVCSNENDLYIASVFATSTRISSVTVGSDGSVYDSNGSVVTIYKSGLSFENSETTINVTVKKSIEGNMADKSDEFSFTIEIVPDVSGESFYYEIYDSTGNVKTNTDGSEQSGYFSSDNDYEITFNLGDDEYIVIYGLSSGDSYSVTENLTDESYSVYIDDDDMDGDASTTYIKSGDGNVESDVIVSYLNYKNVDTPTGIVLNYVPYILLVLVACAVGFVFFRRRRANY